MCFHPQGVANCFALSLRPGIDKQRYPLGKTPFAAYGASTALAK
jgi:hypothetical protein